jgi:methylated-DNA-[protein]-cysteine S-methyltransferase
MGAAFDGKGRLKAFGFLRKDAAPELEGQGPAGDQAFKFLRTQLEAYFKGNLRTFNVPLLPEGTDFQLRVWKELQRIPYGRTMSYLELAHGLGDAKALRAVGRANGANPIAILIPCHRVIGADGSLTGYAGGLERKRALLELEGVLPRASSQPPLFE